MATLVNEPERPVDKSIVPPAVNATFDVNPLAVGGGRLAMVIETAKLPVPLALVAETMTFEVPLTVGVPDIKPVVVLTESPAGKPVAA